MTVEHLVELSVGAFGLPRLPNNKMIVGWRVLLEDGQWYGLFGLGLASRAVVDALLLTATIADTDAHPVSSELLDRMRWLMTPGKNTGRRLASRIAVHLESTTIDVLWVWDP